MNSALELSHDLGIKTACDALNLNRATFYRAQQVPSPLAVRPPPPLALSTTAAYKCVTPWIESFQPWCGRDARDPKGGRTSVYK